MTDNKQAPVDKSTWSSVYLQAGDAFLMSTGEMVHAAICNEKQHAALYWCVLLQYQRVLQDKKKLIKY